MECWNGIGGEMVLARKWQAAAGKPRGTGTQAINPGKAKFIAELDKQIGEKCSQMATKLVTDFLAGKETSMKMLCALADELINCEDLVVMSQLCSYAQKLESEQQLSDAEAEAAAKKEQEESEFAGLTVQPN